MNFESSSILLAEDFPYAVQVVKEILVSVFPSATSKPRGINLSELICRFLPTRVDYSMIPVYHAHQIHVPIDANLTSLPAVPQKVFIHGGPNPSFFNIVYVQVMWGWIIIKELLAYSKIHTAKFNATVHMSQLNGLIEDGN